uniref:Rap guanine nucleotide exchange factor 3 n=1 Tax=Myotis myotis TaxID=51298 RepID=A0A7J7Z9D6_MYOMY|nr:Rap guanine nucleotide exchange factor 3 [Myotis myotis]
MKVGWPGESRWQVGLIVEDSPALGAPQVGSLPDVVPEGTLLNMVLRRMHLPRSCSYRLLLEHQRPSRIQGLRWTPLTNSEESLDFSVSLEQASTERVLRAGKQLHRHLLATCQNLIRDRKYHLRLYRQCCSGRELVDGILALGLGVHSRNQAVGICQVLLDEGALCHVKHDWTFQDRDTQFYRFPGPEPEPSGVHELEEELVEAMALLSQRGPDALLTVALRKPPGQRTDEELELIFEELLHIKAVAHLSNSVKRELAAVLLFEPHSKAGTVLFSQGDKGTSWYIIWKGSVNVVTHGKGLVTTLHEGDDFGQLALVNDAPRAATIILREDNCHFLRVDKQDFNRIIKDVEAKTMRLEEHAKDLAVQLTDHDWNLFNSIHQVELIHYVLGPQHLRDVTTANLERFMRRFNELQYWVATELCLCPVPGPRAQLLRKFIKLAAHLKEQKNLNSFFAVMFGLSNSAISRLAHTWERLPHKVRKLYSALERLLDPSWNHRVYRLALTKLSPPVIPFMPLLLKDMTFIHEGNHTLVENLINFEKMRMMARAVRMLHHCRSHSNVPLSPLRSRVSHLHEDSQAARVSTCSEQSLSTRSPASTWAYVQQLKVIDNQRELSRLSRELEP